MAMQRDGNSDDRTKSAASGRTPPVIEAQAVEVSAASDDRDAGSEPAAPATEPDAAQRALEPDGVEEAQAPAAEAEAEVDNGGGAAAIAAPPTRKKRFGALAIFGLLVVACAGAVAWIATPGQRGAGDASLKARVIALLPQSAQRALNVAPAETPPGAVPPEKVASTAKPAAPAEKPAPETSPAGAASPSASGSDGSTAAAPQAAAPEKAAPEKASTPETTAAAEPKPAEPPADKLAAPSGANDAIAPAPAPGAQAGVSVVAAPASPGVDPRRIDDMSARIDGLQGKLDAALGRLDALQSKIELAQGKIDVAQGKIDGAATADALSQAAQRLEALTQRLAAIEQKLEQPKADTRAPQARENANAPSGRETAASRAVVAQATAEALRAGAPVVADLAALKGLGVADEKIVDLAAYAKTGAPTIAQLTQQWRGLRDKVAALDAPPPGASFTDKLAAKAKSVFRVTWAGQGAQNSIGATVARVDAALQKSDLPAAVALCDEFPAVAKNLVADWQKAAAARLKADSAARALLSESISAIGRSSSQ